MCPGRSARPTWDVLAANYRLRRQLCQPRRNRLSIITQENVPYTEGSEPRLHTGSCGAMSGNREESARRLQVHDARESRRGGHTWHGGAWAGGHPRARGEAVAVARAAMETGLAREPINLELYREQLERRLERAHEVASMMVHKAQASQRQVVFPEGDHEKILRASHTLVEEKIALPI